MRRLNRFVAVLSVIGILVLPGCGQVRLGKDRCFMCNESVGIAPDPRETREALVQIYAARAYDWRGIFAVHTWIALKPRNAPQYTVLQVLGWWCKATRKSVPLCATQSSNYAVSPLPI